MSREKARLEVRRGCGVRSECFKGVLGSLLWHYRTDKTRLVGGGSNACDSECYSEQQSLVNAVRRSGAVKGSAFKMFGLAGWYILGRSFEHRPPAQLRH